MSEFWTGFLCGGASMVLVLFGFGFGVVVLALGPAPRRPW